MRTLTWTQHATARRREMGVSIKEVETSIAGAEMTYPNPYTDGTTFVGGRLAIPVSEDGSILTVLWRGREARR